MNGTVVKNQLIFDFASGSLGQSKSIFTSTYLLLNSSASKIHNTFESMLGDNLFDNKDAEISKISNILIVYQVNKFLTLKLIILSAHSQSLLVH